MEDIKIGMVAAVSEVFKFKKENPDANNELVLRHVSNISKRERDDMTKVAMIAAASAIISNLEKNPGITERESIKFLMSEINNIARNIELE